MEEWKEYKLGDISSMKYGKLPPKHNCGNYPIWSGYRYVGMSNTMNCPKDTVIVVARGVGGTGDVKIAKEDCFLTNLSISVDIDKNICNPYYFKYKYYLSNLKYLDSGSAQSQITIDDLKRLIIKLPPLNHQTVVVSILKSLDDKIEINRRINDNLYLKLLLEALLIWWVSTLINDNLEQQAQALFKSWLTECDEYVPISELSLNITDYTKCNKDKVVLINSSDVKEGRFEHKTYSDNKNLKGHFKKRFQKGDILYSQVRPRNRHWAFCYFEADDYLASTQLMVIRNRENIIPNILLYQYIIDYNVWIDFTNKTETRSGTFPQGNYEELSSIIVPFGANMEKITSELNCIYSNIYNNLDENCNLCFLRDTLLPRLMSGELKPSEITL